MLTIEPARGGRAGRGRLAIALAGGGPLGAFYEIGALHALAEALEGRDLTDFEVYVGVSSGSLVAAGLANGFDTTTMGATFINDESTLMTFSPATLLQPAVGEFVGRLAQLPSALTSIVRQCIRDPLHNSWPAALSSLEKLVPTAVFDNRPLERYLREVFNTPGHTDEFRKLRAQLYVVATNLNTATSVAFGDAQHDRVPISRAVVASAALPGLYSAVEIDGQHYVDGALIRTMHASLALDAGCGLVICINPLVPFDASHATARRKHGNLADKGLQAILGQTFRALIHSRMQVGMSSYKSRYPHADMLLLEPDRHDEKLFFANVFRYAGRRHLVDYAYQKTRRDLRAQAGVLGPLLDKHGLRLNTKLLRQRNRTFSTAARERALRARRTTRRLAHALDRLESILHGDDGYVLQRRSGPNVRAQARARLPHGQHA